MRDATMTCPDCGGSGTTIADHVSYGDGSCGWNVPMKCLRCGGAGSVSASTPEWIAVGRRMRAWRLSQKPYRNLSAEATRRGITSVELSRMERGCIEPVPPVPVDELPEPFPTN